VASETDDVSTDDRPLIEFGFARNLGRKGLFRLTDLQALARDAGFDRPASRGPSIDWDLVRELRQARYGAQTYFESWNPASLPSDAERRRLAARVAYGAGDLERTAEAWLSQTGEPVSLFDRLLLAEASAFRPDSDVAAAIAALRPDAPTDALLIEASAHLRRDEPDLALERLEEGIAALAADPWTFDPIVRRAFDLATDLARRDTEYAARLFTALRDPFAAYRFDLPRRMKLVELALRAGWTERCVYAFEPIEPHMVWDELFLVGRRLCYAETGHPLAARAREELEEFYAEHPQPLYDPRRRSGTLGESTLERIEELMEQAPDE
jgi:hypothetical protein